MVLRITVENKGKESKTLDYNSFYIKLKNRRVYPILDRGSYFIDIAEPLRQETELKTNSKNSYVLAYELTEKELTDKYTLKILEQITYKVGEITPEYKTVSLKPKKTIEIENIESFDVGKIATFEESNIGYSSLQVKNFQIKDNFTYQYKYCFEQNKCRDITEKISTNSSYRTLLILESEYNIDKNTLYYKAAKTSNLFPEHFLMVQYQMNSETKIAEVTNKTSATYKNGIILEIPKEIYSASKIDLIVTIRNQRYTIHLKK